MPNACTPRYVMITPARNEGSAMVETILSVVAQSVLPVEWVIVDDGSKDETASIIDRYAQIFPWIHCVHRPDRGFRSPGSGVMEAFYEGYRALRTRDWEFLVKFDADLAPDPGYFQECLKHFADDPQLGIGGGIVYHIANGTREIEHTPRFHVRGATKIYRRECWDGLGGLLVAPGWDTLDEVKANMLHWQTRTFPTVFVRQRRATGSCDGSWADNVKNGKANYISGYHPLFMVAKCIRRLGERPYVIGSAGLLLGYISGFLKRTPQVDDRALIRYLRDQQLRRLRFAESIWE
jgi:poly-beta-1,6-N-acetyl-D-glucosamine synthase